MTKTLAKALLVTLAVLAGAGLWLRGSARNAHAAVVPAGGGVAAPRQVPGERSGPAPVEAHAPALALPDPSGRVVDLASFRGRPVVVNFWATWCPPCRFEIPDLSAYYRARRDRCFEMLGVAEDSGTPAEVASAARRLGIAYPVLVDAGGRAAERFGVEGLPQTVVVDGQGNVRRVFLGPIGKAELDAALAPLLPAPGKPCPRA